MSLIVFLIVGVIAGWLAGQIVKGGGFGLIGDLVVGVVGAFIGGWLLPAIHFPAIGNEFITEVVYAVIGAIILLVIIKLVRRA